MRSAARATLFGIGLLAMSLPAAAPRAEDGATIPGASRNGATMQRPMAENPEMKPFMGTAPARQAAAPQAADIGGLLRRAEAEMTANRMPEADSDLAQAQAALVQANASGQAVPQQAMGTLTMARRSLQEGRAAEAMRATETALAQLR